MKPSHADLLERDEQIANLAHELRNAMTGILGFAQVASRHLTREPERAGEYLQLIESESRRCLALIGAALGRPLPARSEIELPSLISAVERLMQVQLRQARVKLEVLLASDLPRIQVEGGALEQVLINLITNAIQAMSRNGGSSMRLLGHRAPDGFVLLQVSDDGPGVRPELAEQLFDPFFTTRGEVGGTGLGLSLSRGIIERHGGTLSIEAPTAGGAIFTIRLPGVER